MLAVWWSYPSPWKILLLHIVCRAIKITEQWVLGCWSNYFVHETTVLYCMRFSKSWICINVRSCSSSCDGAGLQCYICDSTSYLSYTDAEADCNADSLRRCPDTKVRGSASLPISGSCGLKLTLIKTDINSLPVNLSGPVNYSRAHLNSLILSMLLKSVSSVYNHLFLTSQRSWYRQLSTSPRPSSEWRFLPRISTSCTACSGATTTYLRPMLVNSDPELSALTSQYTNTLTGH